MDKLAEYSTAAVLFNYSINNLEESTDFERVKINKQQIIQINKDPARLGSLFEVSLESESENLRDSCAEILSAYTIAVNPDMF